MADLRSSGSVAASGRPTPPPAPRAKWGPAQYLAIIGAPVLVWFVWSVVAWAMAGPFSYPGQTGPERFSNPDWWMPRIWETLVIVNAVFVLGYLIRGCRRQGRIFTFDVLFCLCGLTGIWADLNVNYIAPHVLINANWINFNSICGYTPGVINPDCSRSPDPMLFFGLLFTFGLLTLAIGLERVTVWMRGKRPHWSRAQQMGALFVLIMVVDAVFEYPIVATCGWCYPPGPLSINVGWGGHNYYFETFEWAAGACFLGVPAFIRIFRDDRGRTLVEQKIDYMPYPLQKLTTFLSMFLLFQIGFFILGSVPAWVYSQWQHPYEPVPAYIANDICDIPGVTENTRYGPCPGSPGWRMPGRTSNLPGANP
jgi:hypothetical protein